MKYVLYLLNTCCIVLLCILSAYSQNQALQTRHSISLDKKINGNFDLEGKYEVRLKNISPHFDKHYIELKGEYKGFDWLDMDLGYRFTRDKKLHFTEKLHRVSLDLDKEIEIDGINTAINNNIKFLSEYATSGALSYQNPKTYFQNEITATYHITNWKPNPYFAFKYYVPLYQKPFPVVDKNRFTIGTDFALINNLELDISYMFEKSLGDTSFYLHILSFGLTFGY